MSWQVHRSIAVLVKGSSAAPFLREFHRLYFSSEPVPGFVTFITVPRTLPLYTPSGETKVQATGPEGLEGPGSPGSPGSPEGPEGPGNPESPEGPEGPEGPESPDGPGSRVDQHRSDTQKQTECPQLISVSEEKLTGLVSSHVEKHQNQVQRHHLSQTHLLHSLTICPAEEAKVHYQSSGFDQVAPEGLFFQRRNENRRIKPLVVASSWKTQRELTPNVERQFDNLKLQQQQANRGLRFTRLPGLVSSVRRLVQPPLQSQPATDGPGLKVGIRKSQFQTDSQQPPSKLNWIPHSRCPRVRPVSRSSFFDRTYGTGQKVGGLVTGHPVSRSSSFNRTYWTGQKVGGQVTETHSRSPYKRSSNLMSDIRDNNSLSKIIYDVKSHMFI